MQLDDMAGGYKEGGMHAGWARDYLNAGQRAVTTQNHILLLIIIWWTDLCIHDANSAFWNFVLVRQKQNIDLKREDIGSLHK